MNLLLKTMEQFLEDDQKIASENADNPVGVYYSGAVARDQVFIKMLKRRIWADENLKSIKSIIQAAENELPESEAVGLFGDEAA